MAECQSEFTLLCWISGDTLSEEERDQVALHLQACEACQKRIDILKNDIQARQPSAKSDWQQIRSRLSTKNPKPLFTFHLRWILPAAAVVVATLVIVLFPRWITETEESHQIRTKGHFAVEIWGKDKDGVFQVKNGAEVMPNTQMRLVLHLPSPGYVAVFSIDSKTEVSPLYLDTSHADDCLPLKINELGTHELPGSFVLDDNLGTETVYVLFSQNIYRCGLALKNAQLFQRENPGIAPSASDMGFEGHLKVLRLHKSKNGRSVNGRY